MNLEAARRSKDTCLPSCRLRDGRALGMDSHTAGSSRDGRDGLGRGDEEGSGERGRFSVGCRRTSILVLWGACTASHTVLGVRMYYF